MAQHIAMMMFYILFLPAIGHGSDTSSKEKRLLANDPNYIHQVEVDVQNLKAKVYEITTNYAALSSNVADMTNNISKLTTENAQLLSQNSGLVAKNAELTSKYGELKGMVSAINVSLEYLEDTVQQTEVASVYIRWGRTSCPVTAELVHTGYVGGSWPGHTGAAVNYLCMPKHPTWRDLAGKTSNAYVYGGEYEDDFHSSFPIDDYEVPCSVCRINKSSILMIPATTVCFGGWTLEYEGDLAAGDLNNNAASEYVCLDKDPERTPGTGLDLANHQGKSFYPVGSKCGTLPCPPYVEGGELSCAVCSK